MRYIIATETSLKNSIAEMEAAKVVVVKDDATSEQVKDAVVVPTPHQIAAAILGQRGGQKTSPAKAAAARANGRKGGRPRRKK